MSVVLPSLWTEQNESCEKMRYIIDHDLHIHSNLSSCSNDTEQTPENILKYAKENGLKQICLTNHFWDENVKGESGWYAPQNFKHISKAKPLPQAEGIEFLFGAETELNLNLTVGMGKDRYDEFDFFIIPTTHLHMVSYTEHAVNLETPQKRAEVWVKRLDAVLNMDLPFHKIGIAHLACPLIAPTRELYLETLNAIPEREMLALFAGCAEKGVGIELNSYDMKYEASEQDTVMRMFSLAKEQGCKFYLGSDAHARPNGKELLKRFNNAIDYLGLEENDKFILRSK
ncbi:MAG: PHP domain-containing protein [Clostridia bacterium]|nr:PHP domain-containing protein [Clostridia bacterium]